MKLNTYALCVIILLIADCSILSRKIKKKNALKSRVDSVICKAITKGSNADTKTFFPQDVQTEDITISLAKQQTKAARKFFYKAEKNIKIQNHFSILANSLNDIFANQVNGSKTNRTIIDLLKDTRQASVDLEQRGSLDTTFSKFMSIFDTIGKVDPTICDNTCMRNKITEMIESVISYISFKKAKGVHYLGFLGLLADLGGNLNDSLNRIEVKSTESREDVIAAAKTKAKADFGISNDCVQLSIDYYQSLSPDNYYNSSTKNRNKKTERGNCVKSNTDTKLVHITRPRAGVLDIGGRVDEEMTISEGERLAHLQWPLQTVPNKFLKECKKNDVEESKEPWAGHFSGTMYDLIVMQEVLLKMKNQEIKTDDKKIIAGVSAAFLISNGMHSAIEVSLVMKNYLEGAMTYEDYMKGPCTDATKDVSDLITELTK